MLEPASVASLIEVMQEQLQTLQDLIEIGDKKAQVLVEGKLPELDVLVKGEQALLVHLNRAESKRYALQQQLAVQCGAAIEAFTFSQLISSAEPKQAQVLRRFQVAFEDSVARLSSRQQKNAALIQQAMQYVDFSLQLITGAKAQPTAGSTYTPQGQRQGTYGPRPNKLMDGRI